MTVAFVALQRVARIVAAAVNGRVAAFASGRITRAHSAIIAATVRSDGSNLALASGNIACRNFCA